MNGVQTFNRKGAILLGLNERNVTMKVSNKWLNTLYITSISKQVQTSLQWIILKKARPPKYKYIPLAPRE